MGYIPHEHDIEQFFELIHELIFNEIGFLKREVPDVRETEFTADIVYGLRCINSSHQEDRYGIIFYTVGALSFETFCIEFDSF